MTRYRSSPFEIHRGNDLSPKFIYKLNKEPQDISLASLIFIVTLSIKTPIILIEKKNTAALGGDDEISWFTNGTDGAFYVHLIASDTLNLSAGKYQWEIKMVLDGETTTIGQNEIEILPTALV